MTNPLPRAIVFSTKEVAGPGRARIGKALATCPLDVLVAKTSPPAPWDM